MRRRLWLLIAFVVAAGVVAGLAYEHRQSPGAKQERLVEQFIAILPDSLSDNHIVEIRQMFYLLRERAALGKVKPETLEAITEELAAHVARGRITPTNLIHFMAEVGYSTYKDEPRYNPPDGSVDHPVLNPNAAMVKLGYDSTQYDSAFWAEYRQFERAHKEEFSDSASGPVQGRRR